MFHSTALLVVLLLAGSGALPQLADPRQSSPEDTPDREGEAADQPTPQYRIDYNFAPFESVADGSEAPSESVAGDFAAPFESESVADDSTAPFEFVAGDSAEPFESAAGDSAAPFESVSGHSFATTRQTGAQDGVISSDDVNDAASTAFGVPVESEGASKYRRAELANGDDANAAASAVSDVASESEGVNQYERVSAESNDDNANDVSIADTRALEPQQELADRQGRANILASLNFRQDQPQASPKLARDVCGVRLNSVPDVFTRIVGGTTAEKHEFPWQASLQWRHSWYNYHICGASVLSSDWVLTAAHCTHQFKPSDMIIIAGVHNIKHREGSEQKREIDRVAEHWAYNPSTQENDIALVRVSTPFILDGMTVSPVCVPYPGHTFQGDCVVSGWGKVSEHGQSSDELRKVVVPIISREQCIESYRVVGYTGPISEKMMCAGYSQGAKDACQGDSGGPFVCRGQDNRYTIAGVVSWGVGCARPNVPGVYTQVSHYTIWISSIVHGRADVTDRRDASIQSSLHLNDFFNISVDASDYDDSGAAQLRSDTANDESPLAAAGILSFVADKSE